MAYTAHIVAAFTSLWNVAGAAATVQHFKSQPAANDTKGCTANAIEGGTCNDSEIESKTPEMMASQ